MRDNTNSCLQLALFGIEVLIVRDLVDRVVKSRPIRSEKAIISELGHEIEFSNNNISMQALFNSAYTFTLLSKYDKGTGSCFY